MSDSGAVRNPFDQAGSARGAGKSAAPFELGERARMAATALRMESTEGVPSWMMHVMDTRFIEAETGREPGSYAQDPDAAYLDLQKKAGVCMIDQYLATNPLTMDEAGLGEDTEHGATTGAEEIELDGLPIDSAEAAAEHLESVVFPRLEAAIDAFDEKDGAAAQAVVEQERGLQALIGPGILKAPYGNYFNNLPSLRYGQYGYAHYLTAFCLFPDLMARDFKLQADLAEKANRRAARAIVEGGLPKVLRLDHDMADSHGTLVPVEMLDEMWFPEFERCVRPYLEAGVRLVWHCDGDLSEMVPRLIEAGVGGFQGFQYEDNMDYAAICRMTARDGGALMIWAGVSVTRTLPFGTPDDVKREMRFLVEEGPDAGLFLGGSSSIAPGVPWENLRVMMEGLRYYQERRR